VTEYSGCEIIRDREAKTAKIVQSGYAERVSIVGCLSYLVNMTRPDLAFSYSQLSKFVQYPGMAHLEVAERVLQYVRATYDQVEIKGTNWAYGWIAISPAI
jgi:hypothetical protein